MRSARGGRPIIMLRRTAWIWAVGCVAWFVSGGLALHAHALQHAELDFLLSVLFAVAWMFYRTRV